MQLTIHIEPFRNGFIALAVDPSKGDTEDGIPGGLRSTEQHAAQAALNAYFRDKHQPDPANPVAPVTASALSRGAWRRASEAAMIREMLSTAIIEDKHVTLGYKDANGDRSVRTIKPSSIEPKRSSLGFPLGEYVTAWDPQADAPRTFKLDRIEYVEGEV